jgi:hypothetical protein
MTPAAIPGPHPQPHPRPRHWAEASVVLAATVPTIVAAISKLTMVFFINVSPWWAPTVQIGIGQTPDP